MTLNKRKAMKKAGKVALALNKMKAMKKAAW